MEKLVLEITLPKIEFKQFVKLDSFPVKIGRGYNNDVIIQDEYVSENHLELNYIGNQIVLKDLNSENGIFIDKKERIDGEALIHPDKSVTIGKTSIKIMPYDHQISKTKKLNINKSFSGRYKIVVVAWVLLVLNIMITVMINHSNTFRDEKFMKLFNDVPAEVMVLIIWAGILTFIGKLFKKESAFHKQLLYICILIIILTLFPFLKEIILFNSSNLFWRIFLGYIAILPIICYYFIVILKDATKLSLRKLKLFIPIIVIVFSTFLYFSDYIKSVGYNSNLSYERTLQSKYFKIVKSKTIKDFCLESEALFQQISIDD
ncbi:MAG: FHA domain-containing protein [Candidatus Cloacimonetes bacterium]|nr:FHA domain-containing protein [Candidatus Cloacimonadota bacterium]